MQLFNCVGELPASLSALFKLFFTWHPFYTQIINHLHAIGC
jgi:hypothetical protein